MNRSRFNYQLIVAALFISIAALTLHSLFKPSIVTLEMSSSEAGDLQIFWKKNSQPFTELRSRTVPVRKSSKISSYKVELPTPYLSQIRIDPLNHAAEISIHSMRIKQGLWSKVFLPEDLTKNLLPIHQVSRIKQNEHAVVISASGNDSQLLLSVSDYSLLNLSFVLVLIVAFFSLLLSKKISRLHQLAVGKSRLIASLNKLNIHSIFITVLLSAFFLSVIFKIHGSSLHAWHANYPGLFFSQEQPLFGQPRAIRSDEWLVHTPAIVSQSKMASPFSTTNPSYGAGSAPMLMGLPTAHVSTLFRPQYWGFFFLDIERAFSWWWNFRIASCLLGVYLLLRCLTRGRSGLSIVGSLWFFSSEFVQWWLSSGVPELVGSFSLAFSALFYLLVATSGSTLIPAAIALAVFGLSFALQIYPPFQVPLIWLGIALLATLFSSKIFRNKFRARLRLRLILLSIVLISSILVLLTYFYSIQESAKILSATAYPGVRIETGGSFAIARYFSGFGAISMSESSFPDNFGNISEGSSFFLIWPLVLVIFIFSKKNSFFPATFPLTAFLFALSSFILLGWPAWMAKITMMHMVASNRAMIAIGLANVCLTIMMLSAYGRKSLTTTAVGIVAIVLIVSAWYSQTEDTLGEFFDFPEHIISVMTILLLGLPIIFKKRMAFGVGAIVLSLVTSTKVNPVSIGLGPLLNNRVTELVSSVPEKYKSTRWLIYGDFLLPSLFKASGVEVMSGAKYVPQHEIWTVLDPTHQFTDIYNRYAHFQFEPQAGNAAVDMKLLQADLVRVKVAPCAAELENLGVDVVVLPGAWSNIDVSCFKSFPSSLNKSGLSVYLR